MTSRLQRLQQAGVSIWLDTLSRDLLDSGAFATLIRDRAITGATSNPTIFAKAITGSEAYDTQLRALLEAGGGDPQELFFELGLRDIRGAAAELRAVHESSAGADGFVSFECTPDLAHDAEATIAQATQLSERLAPPNVMIKVPATAAGVSAIEELTARGVNINVTLLFSVDRYEQVIEAYLRGLERRVAEGRPIASLRSVASFFVSRVDAKADASLQADSPLRSRIAVANARLAYSRYRQRFAGPRWEKLREHGATAQRPLWASTGTKDPAYSDVLYVEQLVAPDVINTMPEATLLAFDDHGEIASIRPRPRPAATDARRSGRSRRRPGRDHHAARARRRGQLLRLLSPAPALHRSQGLATRRPGDVRPAARETQSIRRTSNHHSTKRPLTCQPGPAN